MQANQQPISSSAINSAIKEAYGVSAIAEQFDLSSAIYSAIVGAYGVSITTVQSVDSPEEAYKRFTVKVSQYIGDAVAKSLAEAVTNVRANGAVNTTVNGVDWLEEFLTARPCNLQFDWATPGYDSPMCCKHHMSFSNGKTPGDGEVATLGMEIGIGITIRC
jgi:hypothetical protein